MWLTHYKIVCIYPCLESLPGGHVPLCPRIIVKTAQIRNGPGQNGPNPKRPNPKRPNFFGQNGPTFFFWGNWFNLRISGIYFSKTQYPQPTPAPLLKLFHIPVPLSKYVSVQITIVLDFWLLGNYLVYIIHSYIYLYLISHFLVRSTGADPGIFIRGIIGKSLFMEKWVQFL